MNQILLKIKKKMSVYIFCHKMSVYILPENVKLKGKDKRWTADNMPLYTSSHALPSLKVSRKWHLSFSSYDRNKRQNVRLQSVWKRLFHKKEPVFCQKERRPFEFFLTCL